MAEEYDISSSTLASLVWSESRFDTLAVGDAGHARGLAQINDKYWPEVTPEQAFDPEFSLRFAAKKIQEDKLYLWTAGNCYSYAKLFVKLPKMVEVIPNTTPAVGRIAIFQYGELKHIAVITKLGEKGFWVREANYIPALIATRFIPWEDVKLRGFYAPSSSVETPSL